MANQPPLPIQLSFTDRRAVDWLMEALRRADVVAAQHVTWQDWASGVGVDRGWSVYIPAEGANG